MQHFTIDFSSTWENWIFFLNIYFLRTTEKPVPTSSLETFLRIYIMLQICTSFWSSFTILCAHTHTHTHTETKLQPQHILTQSTWQDCWCLSCWGGEMSRDKELRSSCLFVSLWQQPDSSHMHQRKTPSFCNNQGKYLSSASQTSCTFLPKSLLH